MLKRLTGIKKCDIIKTLKRTANSRKGEAKNMKIETAIKRAKEKSGTNKELYKMKLFSIGLKYFNAKGNPLFSSEWAKVWEK